MVKKVDWQGGEKLFQHNLISPIFLYTHTKFKFYLILDGNFKMDKKFQSHEIHFSSYLHSWIPWKLNCFLQGCSVRSTSLCFSPFLYSIPNVLSGWKRARGTQRHSTQISFPQFFLFPLSDFTQRKKRGAVVKTSWLRDRMNAQPSNKKIRNGVNIQFFV